MPKSKHKYRVSVYLGKEHYEFLEEMSQFMGVSISTLAKIIMNTGFELSKSLDSNFMKGGQNNGE